MYKGLRRIANNIAVADLQFCNFIGAFNVGNAIDSFALQ